MRKRAITSVITGDIINSRSSSSSLWLPELRKILVKYGSSPGTWEVFRGDSFQVEIVNPENALFVAIQIKAAIKAITTLDVRMAIGIGRKIFNAKKVTESNGEAFVFSGEKLDSLKDEWQTLAVKTKWHTFDREFNLLLKVALVIMDNWSVKSAELVTVMLNHPNITQTRLARKFEISQSSVSERQKRSYYVEIMDVESYYRERIHRYIKKSKKQNKKK